MLLNLLKSLRPARVADADGPFAAALARSLGESLSVSVEDNVDRDRFRDGDASIAAEESTTCANTIRDLLAHADEYERTYALFADEASRDLFVKLVTYRVLGYKHVRLPTNTPEHWAMRAQVDAMPSGPSGFAGYFGPMRVFDFTFEGERLRVEAWPYAIAYSFLLRQYFFERDGVVIQPRPGDHVIDAGACFGETALAFAASVGAAGRVTAFEVSPVNMGIANRNLEANPALAARIDLRECALAADETPLYLEGGGPAARVAEAPTGHRLEVATVDALVDAGEIPRVDFIKMDIEGAERLALAGAARTLKRDRPALAISLYHRPDDLWVIPRFLDSLNAGYRYYLDHYTIFNEETVLYASATR